MPRVYLEDTGITGYGRDVEDRTGGFTTGTGIPHVPPSGLPVDVPYTGHTGGEVPTGYSHRPHTSALIRLTVRSMPPGATIYVDGESIHKNTPSTLIYKEEELLTPKQFKVVDSDDTDSDQYMVEVKQNQALPKMYDDGIVRFGSMLVVSKFDGTLWNIISSEELDVMGMYELDFKLLKPIIPPEPDDEYSVIIESSLAEDGDITYKTSKDQYPVYAGIDPNTPLKVDGSVKLDLSSQSDKWIEFAPAKNISELNRRIEYVVTKPNGKVETVYDRSFRLQLNEGTTSIKVSTVKIAEVTYDKPVAIIDEHIVEFNLIDFPEPYGSSGPGPSQRYGLGSVGDHPFRERTPRPGPAQRYVSDLISPTEETKIPIGDPRPPGKSLKIPYKTTNSDYLVIRIGNVTRTYSSHIGDIEIFRSDFPTGLGQYTMYVQPYSHGYGSGDIKQVTINVVKKEYLPGPDITHIEYPKTIVGQEFKGYDQTFKVHWRSVNTNWVDIYVGKADQETKIAKVAPDGTSTFNVGTILSQGKIPHGEDDDFVIFKLIFVPKNIEGDSEAEGKHEVVEIKFDKGNLKLLRRQVIQDIRESFLKNLDKSILEKDISKYLTHNLHFGGGNNKLIATWLPDTETFSKFSEPDLSGNIRKLEENRSLVLKLYEPLPKKIQPNDRVWISKIQAIPIIDTITLSDETLQSCSTLQPNFNLDLGDHIGFQIMDDLIANGSKTSTEIINEFLAKNEFSLDKLNLNYISEDEYLWENFVKFSSAVERVENFKYKIETILRYQNDISKLKTNPVVSLPVQLEIEKIQKKIQNVLRGFDAFEKLLYDGKYPPLTYPRDANGELESLDSQNTKNWYGGIIASAREYDDSNLDLLTKHIPNHVTNDTENDDFTLFFNMIGQHFDILESYIKGITDSKKVVHKYHGGVSNDLIYHMLKSLGWDADMGVDSQLLWEYAFGTDKDGNEKTEYSGKRRQREVWRRLLNNLPYIYKHKGTKRALNAAMSCYGIPTTLLTIMEFGSPDDPTDDTKSGSKNFTFDDRTSSRAVYSCDMGGKVYSSKFISKWMKPNIPGGKSNPTAKDEEIRPAGIEFRFKLSEKLDIIKPIELFKTSGGMRLLVAPIDYIAGDDISKYQGSSTRYGKFILEMKKGSSVFHIETGKVPLYGPSAEWTNVVVQRYTNFENSGNDKFELTAKQSIGDRITREVMVYINTIPTGTSNWATGTTITFMMSNPTFAHNGMVIGEFDEIRFWRTPLNEASIENHTKFPNAIDGNLIHSSYHDLLFRLDFEVLLPPTEPDKFIFWNSAPNSTMYGYTPSETGFTIKPEDILSPTCMKLEEKVGNDKYPYGHIPYERSVTARVPSTGIGFSDKIHFADNTVETHLKFGEYVNKPKTSDADDSNKLGLFFSPNREVDMDILRSLGDFNIDDYIGDPADMYHYTYTDLDDLRNEYFKRFNLNIYEYIQLIKYIDKTIFDTLKSLVPGRANVVSGLLIEPHFLERPKIVKHKPKAENELKQVEIDVNETTDINVIELQKSVEIDANDDTEVIVLDETKHAFIQADDDTDIWFKSEYYTSSIDYSDDTTIIFENELYQTGIDASMKAELQGWYDSIKHIEVGTDPNSVANAGFGVYGENGHVIRTYFDMDGNLQHVRQQMHKITEKYTVMIPENVNPRDPSMGTYKVPVEKHRVFITTQKFGDPKPTVHGNVIKVEPINGYFDSHYKFVGDLTTGLQRGFYDGSRQTSETTLDGGPAVQTFFTNPNIIKVNDTDRNSGTPILDVR